LQNLISIWSALDLRRRAIVLGATVAMFLAVLGLARMAGSPQMVLLYAGLEAGTAGEMVTALDQRGVALRGAGRFDLCRCQRPRQPAHGAGGRRPALGRRRGV
jgi:flagellar M-ring protein FliF